MPKGVPCATPDLWKTVEISLLGRQKTLCRYLFYPVFMRVRATSGVRFRGDLRAELRKAAIYAITMKQA
ncbi:MAG TPA: hypothetical protein VFU86_05050 [Terriglobales bacterium]|nr:hypothetical protein [Terriglobales bacterium]